MATDIVNEVGGMVTTFSVFDYIVFLLMLLICIIIGIYFGFFHASKNSQEYLVGGRTMKVFPVAMSLIASFISGITLLGTPTEMYIYGMQYMYIMIGIYIMGIVKGTCFLPVFHDLKLISTYEYLERRFDKKLRLFGSILFSIGIIFWLPIVIFVPALAFNQVTGINIHIITPAVCLVCIFYTCVGGIKAVIWTDVIQTIAMFGSIILIMVKGTYDVGGVSVVWNRNMESGRIEPPDLNFDPRTRHTIWGLVFGGFFFWLQTNACNQSMLQRYLALPSRKHTTQALIIFILGISSILICCCYSGLLIYATFHDCDPLTTKLAKAKDQLLPLLVMKTLGNYPGLPGLFVAGVFSAALSSLSTGLNSMAAIVLEDFWKPYSNKKLTTAQTDMLMKTVVVVIGISAVALAFVVEKMGQVLQLSMSLSAITNGPSLGIFIMGLMLPWIGTKGALIGGISGLSFMTWLIVNTQHAITSGHIKFQPKPVSTEGCDYLFTPTSPPIMNLQLEHLLMNGTASEEPEGEVFALFQISYMWYTMLGTMVTIFVGLLVARACDWNDPRDVDKTLLSPLIRRFIKPRKFLREPESPDDIIDAYSQRPLMKLDIAPHHIEIQKIKSPASA